MTILEARQIGIAIDCPLEHAYEFAHLPDNFPRWATGLSSSLHRRDGEWRAETPQGEALVRFSPPNAYGVLDHWVILPDRPPIHIPLRLIENGSGTQVVFTLYRQPGMSDKNFKEDAALVEADLNALKRLLEGTSAR